MISVESINTNGVELCVIEQIEWISYEGSEDALNLAISEMAKNGQLHVKRDGVLWWIGLNHNRYGSGKVKNHFDGLTEVSRMSWKPLEDGMSRSGFEIVLEALNAIVQDMLIRNNFSQVENGFVANVMDCDRQFCRPSSNLGELHGKASHPQLVVSLEYKIHAGVLCIYVIIQRKMKNEAILPVDAFQWMHHTFLGLEQEYDSKTEDFRDNIWYAKDDQYHVKQFPAVFVADYPEAVMKNRELEVNSVVENGPRKRPRNEIEQDEHLQQGTRSPKMRDSKQQEWKESCKELSVPKSMHRKLEENAANVFTYLAQQVAHGLTIKRNGYSTMNGGEQICCPAKYRNRMNHSVTCTSSDYICKLLKDYVCEYSSVIRKCQNKQEKGMDGLLESENRTIDIQKSENHDGQDDSTVCEEKRDLVRCLTALEMQWAAILLQQEALVPWRHADDRWLAVGKTNLGETPSLGEKLVTMNQILPSILVLRDWLVRNHGVNTPGKRSTKTMQSSTNAWMSLKEWANPGDRIAKQVTSKRFSRRTSPRLDSNERPGLNVAASLEQMYSVPNFVVGFADNGLRIPPEKLSVWETAHFQPYVDTKDVDYLVLCPSTVQNWVGHLTIEYLRNISAVYQDCGLGEHTAMIFPSDMQSDLKSKLTMEESEPTVYVPSPEPMNTSADFVMPFQNVCKLLKPIVDRGTIAKSAFSDPAAAIVIYVVSPFNRNDSVNRYKLLAALSSGLWREENDDQVPSSLDIRSKSVVFEIIHIDQLIQIRSMAPVLREICFSVFNKIFIRRELETPPATWSDKAAMCRTLLTTLGGTESIPTRKFMYEPLYVLSPSMLKEASENTSPELTNASTALHGSYGWSQDQEWFVYSWADSLGDYFHIDSIRVSLPLDDIGLTSILRTFLQQGIQASILLGEGYSELFITRIGRVPLHESTLWKQLFDAPSTVYPWTITILGLVGQSFMHLLPSAESGNAANDLKLLAFGCTSNMQCLSLNESPDCPFSSPAGYLITSPRQPDCTPPSALGGAVIEDIVAEHSAEVTLEVYFVMQYTYNAPNEFVHRDIGPWLPACISEVLGQFHAMSWLTFHPVSLQRHSPFPVHLAATDSLCHHLSMYSRDHNT